jgi:hypothetical protein
MKKVVIGCTLALAALFVFAGEFTMKIHKSGGGSKKYCYVDFEIDTKGNWISRALYSNGHQIHSMRFISDLYVRTNDGRDVLRITQNRHVKGSGGGSAREETTMTNGALSPEVALLISESKTSMDCRTYDDKVGQEILNKIKEAVHIAEWVAKMS